MDFEYDFQMSQASLLYLGIIAEFFATLYNFIVKLLKAKPAKQVYIVDDDVSVCRALSLLLMTFGFAVKTFGSGEAFFSQVPKSESGCLILDIHMPVMDGWQTLRQLVNAGSPRPVILISAEKKEGLQVKALKNGAVGFLQKPFNDQELVRLINGAFQK